MQIRKLLASKGSAVATIGRSATIREAVAELAAHGVGALVVSDDGEHIDGIVSERDIVRSLDGAGAHLLDQPVASIMSTDVETASPDDDTDALMATMTDHRIRHLPVVEAGHLAGIISIGDVVKSRIDELERDRRELVDYINGR